MIRRVETAEDIDAVLPLLWAFHEASIWRDMPRSEDDVAALVRALVGGAGAVWLSERGTIGVARSPLWFNTSVQVAIEMWWYAEDGQGRALLQTAEDWARAEGMAFLQMTGLVNEHETALRRHFLRQGYEAKQVDFMKRLG